MARHVVRLPDIGEGIAEAEIAAWKVAVGDRVAEDQPLVDLLTDKAAVEIPSSVSGTVVELGGAVGDKLAVGATLIVLETGEQAAPVKKALAAPAVRQRARELGIDLATVRGSGPEGRVTAQDLERQAGGSSAPSDTEEIRIVGIRRRIAEAMLRSKQRIPHFTYVEEVDVTELETLREKLNAGRSQQQAKLTVLPFLLRAMVRVLPEFPQINARYNDETGVLRRFHAVHAGIAAQTPHGLLVPVIRNAEKLDLWQLASEIRRLGDAARAGKSAREELSGSSITVTSLGALGGIVATPIINAPEVAIIAVNRIAERPVVRDGAIAIRRMMNLSAAFDHRIVDGWDAASFIHKLKDALERPADLSA